MRSQQNHPLLRQMSLNAERDRQRHEYEYRQRTNERRMDSHLRLEELLNRRASAIVGDRERREFNRRLSVITGVNDESDEEEAEAHERMDDLFMIEAALYLSMRDREGRPRRNNSGTGSGSGSGNGVANGDGNENSSTGSSRRGGRSSSSRNRTSPRSGLDPQNLIQALLSGRSNVEGDYTGGMSEEAQLEMAIQLSLQQQQEEEESQQQQQQSQADTTSTNIDNNVANANVDHGEEEIVFSS